ncbi:MAG: transcriptional regulator [Thermoprotei archaeon]|nr:MAG: transcriptional regulator [Thermoprotei archaeon]
MTWKTLIVRVTDSCDGTCYGCLWRKNRISGFTLPVTTINDIVSKMKDFSFDESVILCPNPLYNPKISDIILSLKKVARKIYFFIPVNSLSKVRNKRIMESIDELVIVTTTPEDFKVNEENLKIILSQGFTNIALYVAIGSHTINMDNILSLVNMGKEYGLRIRVGEIPYSTALTLDIKSILAKKGYSVGFTYGMLYGYMASMAFIGNYPVTILAKPLTGECRKLFIDPYGRVSKCPLQTSYLRVDKVTSDILRSLIFSECSIGCRRFELIPKIEISLLTPDGKEIPSEVLSLLEVISHVNSLRAACSIMGFSPSTCVEKIRKVEKEVGIKLLISKKGGKEKGATVLTDEARRILEMYREIRDMVSESLYSEKGIMRFKLG